MASTVIKAFEEFQKDKVNLDENKNKKARSSRDWLVTKIHEFTSNDSEFPDFYEEKDIFLGHLLEEQKKEN